MRDTFYVGQVVEISLETTINLTSAIAPKIRAYPPGAPAVDWSATVDGTLLKYTTVKDEDLHTEGEWRLQAIPNIPGAEAPGETVRFTVLRYGR